MRIFVTGATGFIGSAIVQDLLAAGHKVLGLARSDASAQSLAATGAEVHRGHLEDLEGLKHGAASADGVIHTAFIHDDFTKMAAWAKVDHRAVSAMATALEGSDKPFLVASGTALLAHGRLATEKDKSTPEGHRTPTEETMMAVSERGVRGSVVRLPPTVHGAGDHGFMPALVQVARTKGFAAYVGDGANRWPSVHRLDAARVFRLGAEKAKAGTRLHAVAEEGIPMRKIAETIGKGLGIPVRSISKEEAAAHFTWLAYFVGIDNPTSSAITRETLGWRPAQVGLLDDMRQSDYFTEK